MRVTWGGNEITITIRTRILQIADLSNERKGKKRNSFQKRKIRGKLGNILFKAYYMQLFTSKR